MGETSKPTLEKRGPKSPSPHLPLPLDAVPSAKGRSKAVVSAPLGYAPHTLTPFPHGSLGPVFSLSATRNRICQENSPPESGDSLLELPTGLPGEQGNCSKDCRAPHLCLKHEGRPRGAAPQAGPHSPITHRTRTFPGPQESKARSWPA